MIQGILESMAIYFGIEYWVLCIMLCVGLVTIFPLLLYHFTRNFLVAILAGAMISFFLVMFRIAPAPFALVAWILGLIGIGLRIWAKNPIRLEEVR